MQRSDFSYELPSELIARVPLASRTASRLLVVGGEENRHLVFSEVRALLRPGDVLVVNDTRVLKARLRGEKDTGGQAEVLVERVLDAGRALCQVRVSKPLKAGRTLQFGDQRAQVIGRQGEFYELEFSGGVLEVLEQCGEVPLPPYMERAADTADEGRYQTVYSRAPGAVAAPTAGLHFDEALLAALQEDGVELAQVTLHVGAGTFQPVRVDDVREHRMHHEVYEITPEAVECIRGAQARGGRVVAVGTTVVRTLESAARDGALRAERGDTNLFITPGYRFRVVDALITNFHLPESTLLMLVCAFAGYAPVMAAYREAVAQRYRFFSYGDAMFLERADV
jgi:S-adenosylmethionine:tRNA ribosyltransferase-isomerase